MEVRNCKTENTYDVEMELCTEAEESALIFDLSFQFVILRLLISIQLHHLFFLSVSLCTNIIFSKLA